MNLVDNCIKCVGVSAMAGVAVIGIALCAFVVCFDFLCFVSLFYLKNVYETCKESNLGLYVILYLLVPYVVLGKSQVIVNGGKTASTQYTSDVLFFTILWNIIMFFWGVHELRIDCVSKLHHSIIYIMSVCITIVSGATIIIFCCAPRQTRPTENNIAVNNNDNDNNTTYTLIPAENV